MQLQLSGNNLAVIKCFSAAEQAEISAVSQHSSTQVCTHVLASPYFVSSHGNLAVFPITQCERSAIGTTV